MLVPQFHMPALSYDERRCAKRLANIVAPKQDVSAVRMMGSRALGLVGAWLPSTPHEEKPASTAKISDDASTSRATANNGNADNREPGDDDDNLNTEVIERVRELIEQHDRAGLITELDDLHEADIAELIEILEVDERHLLFELVGSDLNFLVLTEVAENIRLSILHDMSPRAIASGISELDKDDAVSIIADLEPEFIDRILADIGYRDRAEIKKILAYPENTAGRLMRVDYVACRPDWTVGQTIDYCREGTDLPDQFYNVMVVDEDRNISGTVALDTILRTQRTVLLDDIQEPVEAVIRDTDDQEEAALLFQRYNMVSAPVIDAHDQLVGVLDIDDMVDVIAEEANEDIGLLAGVGNEELSDGVYDVVVSRLPWLVVNLFTAIIASLVIDLFDRALSEKVALAILMPIVASMGGNAGSQSLTIAVRALATNDLVFGRFRRTLMREIAVGLANGVILALLVGVTTYVWFGEISLSVIIGIAMIGNMFSAAVFGLVVPVLLERIKVDPALASSVFVTTATDVVGFFLFLAIAGYWYGI